MADTYQFDVNKLFGVEGFVAVVTGGGTGIGLMAAQALSANGAKVYITGRRKEVLENAAKSHQPAKGNGQIIPIGPCDVTSKDDLEKLVADIGKREKYINLLVCSAGISGAKAEPKDSEAGDLKARLWNNEDPSDWHDNFNTNVTSVYFTTVAFLPLLQAAIRPKGQLEPFSSSVITISSMSGIMRHAQGHFSYNTAKGATVQLTKLMSAEFQKAGIRINSIAPGYFPSESKYLIYPPTFQSSICNLVIAGISTDSACCSDGEGQRRQAEEPRVAGTNPGQGPCAAYESRPRGGNGHDCSVPCEEPVCQW